MSTVEEIYEGEIRRKVTRRTSFKIEEVFMFSHFI